MGSTNKNYLKTGEKKRKKGLETSRINFKINYEVCPIKNLFFKFISRNITASHHRNLKTLVPTPNDINVGTHIILRIQDCIFNI